MINELEVILTNTVLQDCIDRLQIIGRLLPVPLSSDSAGSAGGDTRSEPEKANLPKGVSSRHGLFPVGLVNPISFEAKLPIPEDIFKLQLDREFVEYTLKKTTVELQLNNTYNILLEALKGEYVRRHAAAVVRESEEEKRQQVEVLKCNLANIKQEKERDLNYYTDMIAYLTDQLREARVRIGLEEKYVTKQTTSYLEQGHKRFQASQADVEEKVKYRHYYVKAHCGSKMALTNFIMMLQQSNPYTLAVLQPLQLMIPGFNKGQDQVQFRKLKVRLGEETKTHAEIESYLRANLERLDQKTNYWMEKYETSTEFKDQEIAKLQLNKHRAKVRKEELSVLLEKYYMVIEEDRLEKELMRQMKEEEEMQARAALKIQSWWRGILVRELLGPFRKLRAWFKQRRLEVKKLPPSTPPLKKK